MNFFENKNELLNYERKNQTENTSDLTARQLSALETKKKLFESAIKLFAEKGFNKVSVDEIVAKAGTSKGSFYTHFKSKDQIILEQHKQYDNHYLVVYKDLAKFQTASEKLLHFVKNLYIFTYEKIGLENVKIVYNNGLQYSQEEATFITDESRPLYKVIKEIVREGKEKGDFRNAFSEQELTIMVIRCVRGTFYDWCLYNGNFDLVEDGVRFFSVFMDGLKQPHK